ncbi:MAG TPA: hypothetical protein VG387_05980 [Rhizomicrobium sp.]|jgi:hypothetical protein|nr:hypothetical protein [Rhizomicrobium sp.]
MTELDLLNLARSCSQDEISYFAQMITINFAMVVAIYYFLNQARLAMKLFAFVAYMVGMLLYFGQMLLETNLKLQVLQSLRDLPHPSAVTTRYLALYDTWLTTATAVLFNGAIWVLCLGVLFLLFVWQKGPEERDVRIKEFPR